MAIWLMIFHWTSRFVLAGIFLYAGYTKTALRDPFAPFEFEMAISGYELLPVWGVIAVARTLPWFEIAIGVMLLVGWKLRYFAGFAAFLLTSFLAAMAITFARGIEASCGCFGLGEPISAMTLTRDSLMLVPAIFLAVDAWRLRREESAPPPPAAEQAA